MTERDFGVVDFQDQSLIAEGDDLEELVEQLELQLGEGEELDIYDPWGEDR